MSSLTITLEIGHDSSLREKTTVEGFTHDWEVFVRGCNGADIRNYVERVVFHLHETFEKPKRVVKDPPYSVRTSGYAGFNLPIQIYLKNSQEPRKIQFNYDLRLQPSGPPIHEIQKEKYTFHNVNEEFRIRLLKGGAVVGLGSNSENSVNSLKPEEKTQMTSKPKYSGSDQPKYRLKAEEPRNDQFTNLFGTPITKTSRAPEVSKSKEPAKPVVKSSDKDKISDKNKSKSKSPHKDKDRDKEKEREKSKDKEKDKQTDASNSERKSKDDKKERKDKKEREHSKKDKKDRKDRDKEKDKERDKSPPTRPKSPSPKRSPKRIRSPSPMKSSNKEREQPKEKESRESRDRDREKKLKKHKDKDSKHRDKDKDKERDRDKLTDPNKDYKSREGKSSKDKEREINTSSNGMINLLSKEKERDASPIIINTQKVEKKEKLKEKEPPKDEKLEEQKPKEKEKDKEKSEDKPKHKHKKKDKDRKEKKDKDREEKSHKKDKEEKKQEKEKSSSSVSKEISFKERDKTDNLFGSSPKSEPTSSPPHVELEPEKSNPMMDDESSNGSKISSRDPSPLPVKVLSPIPPPRSPSPIPIQESLKKPPTPDDMHISRKSKDGSGTPTSKKKDKKERKKDKKSEKDHEKKRKRKAEMDSQMEIEEPPVKLEKKEEDTNNNSDDERKVSSTEDSKPIPYSDDGEAYMTMLRELQIKIMGLKNNSHLQKVVQLIAETGRYEVSAHTFDFDLCLLDKSTVMKLQSFFSSVN